MDNKQLRSSLTSFNFQTPEDNTNEEGVLSKIFDKVISAVSGQPHTQDNFSVRTTSTLNDRKPSGISLMSGEHSTTSIPHNFEQKQQQALPNSISTNSSLSRHLTTASSSTTTTSNSNKDQAITNFPTSINPETVPRSSTSTTATTNTTITVGNQKTESKCMNDTIIESNNNSTVQFIMPTNRMSQDDNRTSLDFLLSSPLTKRRSIDSDTQSVATNFSISNTNSLSKILARLRGQKNDKEFWMPDEQCKECYKCRKPFTLLRRKHHCRTCGQIFCNRCASHVISGKMYKQKGQFRVCNFCYAEQLLQLKESIPPSNSDTHDYSLSKHPSNASSVVGNNADTDIQQQQQLQQQQQNQHSGKSYNSNIIPSQKPPLAVPKMQIPATALRHTRSTYGNDDTTTFALEIPTRGSENYLSGSPQTSFLHERPHSSNTSHTPEQYNNTTDSPNLSYNNAISSTNVIPTITTTGTTSNESTTSGGLKRLLDAGTSLLKSTASSRPRSNTSSSAPMEDTRYPIMTQYGSPGTFRGNSNYPLPPYLLDRGGGTVLSESELSPFPGNNDDTAASYRDHLYHPHYDRPQVIPPPPPPPPPQPPIYGRFHTNSSQILPKSTYGDQLSVYSNQANSNVVTTVGSDDESYDHRLRIKRTEELRGKNLPSRHSYNSLRRLSFAGNSGNTGVNGNKKLFRNNMIRINTVGLPKSDFGSQQFNESWSPNPFINDGSQQNQLQSSQQEPTSANKNRLRLPPRQRRISGPPQIVELSLSARTHARRILRQLMEEITLEDTSKRDWEEVIMGILLKVAHNVQPDIRAGDDMDVRHYVKIKKIPGGVPSDSFYVKGVVCTKNVAHKRMMHNISNPRILILLFSLDYSRIEMENQLLSINPVITQEREHIKKLVGRIVALKPSLLVVKSTVSRLALEFLLEAKIPVIHNVKHSVVEAIARCTQASIVTSVDKLQHGLSFGRCGSFEIRTVMHEWIPNRRKTFLIFDNCSPELGGTIVLRGERDETLRVIKRLIDFMVFVVNNLKLETSLLLDSFAKSRGSTEINIGPTVPTSYLSETTKSPLVSVITESTKLEIQPGDGACTTSVVEYEEDDGVTINSHYTTALLKLYQNTILSVSQFVVFPPPYLLVVLKETEDKLALINDQKRRKSASGSSILTTNTAKDFAVPLSASPTRSTFERQSIHSTDNSTLVTKNESSDQYYWHQHWHEEDVAIEAENDLIAKHRQISKAWEAYIGENPEFISPFYHQNIVVLFSTVCTVTTFPCQGPEIRIFSFYRFPSDKTLGQYITDFCTDAHRPCSFQMCDNPMLQHYGSYAHGNARVNVMIEQFPCPLPGMENKLLMWNYCKECNKPTPVLPVSENTWNYSFGKFLEIFLYQKEVYCRADICPHDMNRNHVRYFGYKNLAVRFQYDSIDLLEVTVPPMKLFILSKVQMDIKDAELALLRSKINKFYQSIIERNKAFPFDLVDPHKLDSCKTELQEMSTVAQGEKKDILQHVQNVYANSDPYDTLTISGVRKHLFQIVSHWDAMYADFVRYYLQPERELKKITANHLRKMFPTDISESAISNMDNERTKRATEATDLPLLGIGLDGEDDDTLIGHNYKRKFSAKADECETKKSSQMIFPMLSSSPSERNTLFSYYDDDQPSTSENSVLVDSDHKGSSLRPTIRRKLSLELMNELNEKIKIDEGRSTGIEALNQMNSNKFLRLKSPGSISAAFTPSRIPIPLYSANAKVGIPPTPPLYQLFNRRQRNNTNSFAGSTRPSSNMVHRLTDKKGKKSVKNDLPSGTLPVKIPDSKMPRSITSANIPQRGRHIRHHSIGHSQRLNHKSLFEQLGNRYNEDTDDANEVDDPSTFLQRSITSHKFRSRLPRKKTYIQVYSRANDLVQEDIDDEFYASGDFPEDTISIESTIKNKKKYQRDGNSGKKRLIEHSYGRKRETHAANKLATRNFNSNGDEADNDDNDLSDDSGDDSDKNEIDYFSSLAPYTHKVIEGAAAVLAATSDKETIENQSLPTNLNSNEQQQYQFAKTYFPFSDGQLDMSSGLSGEEENDRDLPCASDLLMDQQTNVDNMSIEDLRNIHPGIIADDLHPSNTGYSRSNITDSLEDGRHSPEKTSFMKTLTNFLTDNGVGNLLPLESPLLPTEYVFPDSCVAVREDEPSTIIAHTLSSEDYIVKMHEIQEFSSDNQSNNETIKPGNASLAGSKAPSVSTVDNGGNPAPSVDGIQETLLRESSTHMRYTFSTGSTKFFCKIFFSEQFDALRKNCGCDESYIMSLASCIKWDSSGGKSGSAFLKTKNDRLLMKQMSKYELDAFLEFAPAYFQHMSKAFFRELPTVLAKIFGFYSIGYKNSVTGKSMRMDVLVMENLFYQRNIKKIFDLKGSMRNRHVQSTGQQDEVLLDENLVELIFQSPLFIRTHSKEILRSSLHNDTLFLSQRGVMDYSLLVGIDEERQELVVGIVDFIRTFTWDKKLESWVKESGILGGGGKGPTIVSPRQYRIRFREAMERYFLMVPDYWALTRQSQSSYVALHHHQITQSDSDGE